MTRESGYGRTALGSASALLILGSMTSTAQAGGFAIREQSASLLGSAFAGAAAGGDLSSSFWNPAAFGTAQSGITSESHVTVLLPTSELSNGKTSLDTGKGVIPFNIGGASATSIDKNAALSASYGAYRINDKMVLGISVNSPFGLSTDPENGNWIGRVHGREATMLTFNATPTLAYEIMPGVQVAAGLQVEYMKLKLWFASSAFPGAPSASIKVTDDASIGGTAGILLNPMQGTRIGIGYRSSISHDLEGNLYTPKGAIAVNAKLDTPDMVTASISQVVMPGLRVLGTVEWTKWSNVDTVPINGTAIINKGKPFVIDVHFDDGWMFSGGVEYDYSQVYTVRAGLGFEKSPVQDPSQRLPQLPDTDRIWATVGMTIHYSESTTFDMAFAHIFFDDGHIHRGALSNPNLILDADVSQDANIFSVGMKTRW